MSVTILCPKLTCRAVLRVPDHVRGKHIRCGECGTAFMVPEQSPSKAKPQPLSVPADQSNGANPT